MKKHCVSLNTYFLHTIISYYLRQMIMIFLFFQPEQVYRPPPEYRVYRVSRIRQPHLRQPHPDQTTRLQEQLHLPAGSVGPRQGRQVSLRHQETRHRHRRPSNKTGKAICTIFT